MILNVNTHTVRGSKTGINPFYIVEKLDMHDVMIHQKYVAQLSLGPNEYKSFLVIVRYNPSTPIMYF